MKYFSKSTNGFYDPEINGENIPADKIIITEEVYQTLLESQASGKKIVVDKDGKPVAI